MQNLFIKKTFLAFIALMMVVSIFAYPGANKVYAEGEQVVNYQEITETKIFDANASWKYFDKGKDLGTDWIQSSFDDKEWKEGSAPLGYGNGFEKTVVGYGSSSSKKYITTYFRKTFNIENAAQVAALKMTLLRDDGAVVYLNGKEVARSNMPDGAVSFSTKGLTCTEETADYSIDPSLLVNGANTLAVEIHQCSGSSSDIAFGMALTAGIAPAAQPTAEPTQAPTQAPEDDEDSEDPTQAPTQAPTGEPTAEPTAEPTQAPTQAPTQVSPVLIDFSNSSWKYFDKGQDLGTDWANGSFDDSSWSEGSAPLGYGNGFEKTVVGYGSSSSKKYITTYFRKTFEVASTAGIEALTLKLLRDDGAVVYLNGKEVVRSNMPDGAVSYSTKALTCTEETADYSIDPSLLVNGKNTVAVEIHQCSGTSSDIAFALGLTTGSTPDPQPTAEPTQAPTQSPTQSPTQVPVPTSTPPLSGSNVFFVAPDGKSGNKGTESSPWDLKTAFSQPSAVKPGATIYLRGGKYKGMFKLSLKGSSSAYITVRNYPGERAILVNGDSPAIDIVGAAYVNLWGLEITGPDTKRSTSRSQSAYGIRVNQGKESHHIRFINMIVHDVQSQGIGWWQALKDTEIYGSLFYFNGTDHFDHGVYAHNVSGNKVLRDSLIFDNASHGLHAYAENADKGLTNITVDGNTFFNNGSIGWTETKGEYGIFKRNILLGGLTRANNPVVTNNATYYPGKSGEALNLGYKAASKNGKVTGNYFAGGSLVFDSPSSLTLKDNTIYAPGGVSGVSKSSYSSNQWLSSKPSGLHYIVRPNQYEPNRAHLTIYNWDKKDTVFIPASALGGVALQPGQKYQMRNAQDYFGDVLEGTYDGKGLTIKMTGHSVAQPIGLKFKPASTFPEFGVFVLIGL